MRATGAIAFGGQFKARENRVAELRVGLRRERCGEEGAGRAVGLGRTEGWQCEGQRLYRTCISQDLCVA